MAERQKKTAQQRAEENLGIALRAEEKAAVKLEAARDAISELESVHRASQARVAYVGIHPDLPSSVRAEYVTDPKDPDYAPDSSELAVGTIAETVR